jgi:3-oxoacyl-[acyl-carrier protein] reductase
MGLLQNKKVLITGGSRGIGAELVRAMLREGADVAFFFRRSSEAAEALCLQMAELYPAQRCLSIQCDVGKSNGMQESVRNITLELGGIDVLVNNAGITRDAVFARMTREQWEDVVTTNLGSMFNVTQPLVLQLVKQRSGSIINITSTAGLYGSSGQVNYSAAKAGVIGFTKALSKELAGFGVRVNAVAPGFIETEMLASMKEDTLNHMKSRIPAGRLGTSEDVAHMVCFLASDRSSYITGQVIQVDGGLTL